MSKNSAKHREKPKHQKRKVIRIIFAAIFLISSICLVYYIYNSHKEKQDYKTLATQNNIATPTVPPTEKTERMKQLEKLQKENKDIIGWLEIEGTNISYPVCQASDNKYYLNHNYKKENSELGSIFLDKDFNISKPSTNYLIYGHRSQNRFNV